MPAFLKAKNHLLRRFGSHGAWIHDKRCPDSRYKAKRYKALLIAINYERPEEQVALPAGVAKWGALTGCRNDAYRVKELLIGTYKCMDSDIIFMSDEKANRGSELYPTKANILRELENFIASSQSGDVFVLYYAGHSGQVKALRDKREKDGKDEYIVTVDGWEILDDDLRKTLVDPLPIGCRFTAIFDSCHSGTLLDLEHYAEPVEGGRHSHPNTLRRQPDSAVSKPRNSLPEELIRTFVTSTNKIRRQIWEVVNLYINVRKIARRARKRPNDTSNSNNDAGSIPAEVPECPEVSQDKSVPGKTPPLEATCSPNIHPADRIDVAVDSEQYTSHRDAGRVNPAESANASTRCKACRLRAKTKIIVSIASCLDSQEAIESAKREEALMTPVLCGLLAENPDMSAEDLARQLQNEMFYSTLGLLVNSRKKARSAAPAEQEKKFQRFKDLFEVFTPSRWQQVQIGSEHPHSIKEPFLVVANSAN